MLHACTVLHVCVISTALITCPFAMRSQLGDPPARPPRGARMDWGTLGSSAGRAALAFSSAFGGQLTTSGTAHLAALAVVAAVVGCACCVAGCAVGWVLRGLLPELLPQLIRLARQPSPGVALAPRPSSLATQRQPAPRGYRLD